MNDDLNCIKVEKIPDFLEQATVELEGGGMITWRRMFVSG